MKIDKILYESVKTSWEEIVKHPFLEEMSSCRLPLEKFKYYLIQDNLYIKSYSKIFAFGILKSEVTKDIAYFANLVLNVINSEDLMHKTFFENLNISKEYLDSKKPNIINISYVNFMWAEASKASSAAYVLMCVLACGWLYGFIGKRLIKKFKNEGTNKQAAELYEKWILAYSCTEYGSLIETMLEKIDMFYENANFETIENLKQTLKICTKFEYDFFDYSYKMEI